MKKIHFDNISKNKLSIAILVLCILCFLIGIFNIIPFENEETNRYILEAGIILLMLNLSKMLWFKYYVQWNKKGAVIKIDSFFGKTIRFTDVKSTELKNKKLIVTKANNTSVVFNLDKINPSDIEKLQNIIIENSNIKTVYQPNYQA